MKFWAHAASAALLIAGQGSAAATDLALKDPPPEFELTPTTLWSGWYVGGHIGGVRGDTDVTDTYKYDGDPTRTTSISKDGPIGGIQIGYNRQNGQIVYGLEADLGKMNISGGNSARLFSRHKNPDNSIQYELDGTYNVSSGTYGDVALRLGYTPTQKALLYLKGGPAFLNADYNSHYAGGHGGWNSTNKRYFDFNHSDTLWGWTVGIGAEYAVSQRLTLKAEYQHFDFGSVSYHDNKNIGGSELDTQAKISPTANAVTVGLNYRLGAHGDIWK